MAIAFRFVAGILCRFAFENGYARHGLAVHIFQCVAFDFLPVDVNGRFARFGIAASDGNCPDFAFRLRRRLAGDADDFAFQRVGRIFDLRDLVVRRILHNFVLFLRKNIDRTGERSQRKPDERQHEQGFARTPPR